MSLIKTLLLLLFNCQVMSDCNLVNSSMPRFPVLRYLLTASPPDLECGVAPLSPPAERSSAKANRILPKEYTGHSKHPLPTTQEKTLHMDITRWSILKSD